MSEHDPDESQRRHHRRRRRHREHRMLRSQRRRTVAIAAIAGLAVVLGAAVLFATGSADQRRLVGTAVDHRPALERSRAERGAYADAIDEVLAYTPYLRAGEPRKREVALTFDDGPSIYTDEILAELKDHDAPATFFVLGQMVEQRPELVRRALREGHAVGLHSYSHPQLGQLPGTEQLAQIEDGEEAMTAHDLQFSRLFRPPYGSFDAETVSLLEQRSELMVLWSVDTGDYENPGWQVIADRALAEVRPGSVILLHDGGGDRAQTLVALPLILKGLKKRGLEPVTVPQLLADNPPPRDQSLEQATAVPQPGEDLPDGPEAAPAQP